MYVKAADGLRVPMEEHPRRYIEETPVHVPDTAYYRRRMADGDLVTVGGGSDANAAKPPSPTADLSGATAPTASPKVGDKHTTTTPASVNEEARRGKR